MMPLTTKPPAPAPAARPHPLTAPAAERHQPEQPAPAGLMSQETSRR
jgi:hypothetical protein